MLIRMGLILAGIYWTDQWVTGVALAVLMLVWYLLAADDGPPVLALALTYQWMQVTIGIFYTALTGDELAAMVDSDWETMVLIGLGCVTALAVSIAYGERWMRRAWGAVEPHTEPAFSNRFLYSAYGVSIAVTGFVQELAWQYPAFTQAILAVNYAHLGLLFLVSRRLAAPVFQWQKVGALVLLEVGLGFTGYFAEFREPLVMVGIAMFEVFDRRDVRHWALVGALAIVLSASSLVWIAVRGQLRQEMDQELVTASRAERFDRARVLTTGLVGGDTDRYHDSISTLIDRLWAIHYPALAVARVPTVLPHTDGQIMTDALVHLVTPRFLYPEKPDLPSDSEMVRKYSGVWVAGARENTSIAFGYAAESYVDFGVPLMFLPILIFGAAMGAAYQCWMRLIRDRELAITLSTVVFWLILYLFERSWVKTLGMGVTLMVYLGGLAWVVDQWLIMRRLAAAPSTLDDGLLDPAIK